MAAGLTQDQVAALLRRPQSLVSNYESGERRLDVIELIEVCEVIGLDPQHLVAELAGIRKD